MKNKIRTRPKLRVITGGLHTGMTYKKLRIIAAPLDSPPFKVNAMAFEEDSYLIMSAKPESAPRDIHPLKLMAELANLEPEKPGTIKVAGKNPIKFLAIIHDVNMDPTWKEGWIESALTAIFNEAEAKRIHSLGLPLLGTKHGKLSHQRFMAIFVRVLRQFDFESLKKLWLIVSIPENAELINSLKSELKINP